MDSEKKWDRRTNPFYNFSRRHSVSSAARGKVYCHQHVLVCLQRSSVSYQGKAGDFLTCKGRWLHPTFSLCGFRTTRLMIKLTVALFFSLKKQTNKQKKPQNENIRAVRQIATLLRYSLDLREDNQVCPSNISSDATYLKKNMFGELC